MAGSFLHRHVWQRVPRGLRRRALFEITQRFAPTIDPDARPQEPIIVAGVLRSATGLGQSARLCYAALRASGKRVFAVDLTKGLRQPEELSGFEFEDGRHLTGAGTLLLHVNSPLVAMALSLLGQPLVKQKRVIGYWAWELPGVPRDWQYGRSHVHDIWVPSRFTAAALQSLGKPIRVVPHAVAAGFTALPREPADRGGPVVLLQFDMTSSFARKNPLAAITAFKRAYGTDGDARLLVKARDSEAFPYGHRLLHQALAGMSNAELIGRTLSKDEQDRLYARADAIISLHRSEGFGLTVAQGMLAGLPVVATDWSGTTDFLDAETGLPVAYDLVPARDPQREYDYPEWKWAEARVDDAAEKLAALRDPALRARIGSAAWAKASELFSAAAYARTVDEILNERAGDRDGGRADSAVPPSVSAPLA